MQSQRVITLMCDEHTVTHLFIHLSQIIIVIVIHHHYFSHLW